MTVPLRTNTRLPPEQCSEIFHAASEVSFCVSCLFVGMSLSAAKYHEGLSLTLCLILRRIRSENRHKNKNPNNSNNPEKNYRKPIARQRRSMLKCYAAAVPPRDAPCQLKSCVAKLYENSS